jgi:hypothetical protein
VSLKNDQLNGFSLFYKKTTLLEKKYSMGIKIKEWNSSEFKKTIK